MLSQAGILVDNAEDWRGRVEIDVVSPRTLDKNSPNTESDGNAAALYESKEAVIQRLLSEIRIEDAEIAATEVEDCIRRRLVAEDPAGG